MKLVLPALLFAGCLLHLDSDPQTFPEASPSWRGVSPDRSYQLDSWEFSVSRNEVALDYQADVFENEVVPKDRMIARGTLIRIKNLKHFQLSNRSYLGSEVEILSGEHVGKKLHAEFLPLVENIKFQPANEQSQTP